MYQLTEEASKVRFLFKNAALRRMSCSNLAMFCSAHHRLLGRTTQPTMGVSKSASITMLLHLPGQWCPTRLWASISITIRE